MDPERGPLRAQRLGRSKSVRGHRGGRGFNDLILATLKDLENLYRELPGPNGSNKTGDQGPFINIQSTYWSLTEIDAARAPIFSFLGGEKAPGDKNFQRYGWAYRFGDS